MASLLERFFTGKGDILHVHGGCYQLTQVREAAVLGGAIAVLTAGRATHLALRCPTIHVQGQPQAEVWSSPLGGRETRYFAVLPDISAGLATIVDIFPET